MQGLQRNVRRTLNPNKNRRARFCANLFRQRRTDQRVAAGGSSNPADAMELPETVVDAIDANLAGTASTSLMADEPLCHYDRRNVVEQNVEMRMGLKIVCKLLAEKARRHHKVVCLGEPLIDKIQRTDDQGLAEH